MTDDAIVPVPVPPKYDTATVARLILEEAGELHPQRLTAAELSARIVTDPDDRREVETAARAIRVLRRTGLFEPEDGDEIARPTRVALFSLALLVM
jgi:hypothetical protein